GTRFGLEGKLAGLTRACSPCLQVRQRAKGLVFVAIDRRVARLFGARCCQRLWGAFQARCLIASVAGLAWRARFAFCRRYLARKQVAALIATWRVAGFIDLL